MELTVGDNARQHCVVRSVDGQVFEGDVTSVSVPLVTGEAEILPGHAVAFMALSSGTVRCVPRTREADATFDIKGGVLYADGNEIIVLI